MAPADTEAVVVFVTGPDEATLVSIAETVVGEGLVACMNIIPAVRSIYAWDGVVRNEGEALGIIKTVRHAVPDLQQRVLELHPYDVPEFLSVTVDMGDRRYLDWISNCITGAES